MPPLLFEYSKLPPLVSGSQYKLYCTAVPVLIMQQGARILKDYRVCLNCAEIYECLRNSYFVFYDLLFCSENLSENLGYNADFYVVLKIIFIILETDFFTEGAELFKSCFVVELGLNFTYLYSLTFLSVLVRWVIRIQCA